MIPVLQAFLVKLGFSSDASSAKKMFNGLKTIKTSAQHAQGSLESLRHSAVSAVSPVGALAREMNQLFYATRLADSSAVGLRSLTYASEKAGIASEMIQRLATSIATWKETDPGRIGIIESLAGVSTAGKDTTQVVKELMESIADMDPLLAKAVTEQLGISYEDVRLWRDFRAEIQETDETTKALYASLHLDMEKAKVAGREYANILHDVGVRWDMLKTKSAMTFLPMAKAMGEGAKSFLEWMMGKDDTVIKKGEETWTPEGRAKRRAAMAEKEQQKEQEASKPMTKSQYLRNLEEAKGIPAGTLDAIWAMESGRGSNKSTPAATEKNPNPSASGDFQFINKTAKYYGLKNKDSFEESATAAASYMSDLLKAFKGDLRSAVTAYHEGEGAVRSYGPGSAMLTPAGRGYYQKFQAHIDRSKLGKDPGQERGATTIEQNNTTHVTVNGAKDPQATGNAVASKVSAIRNNWSAGLGVRG